MSIITSISISNEDWDYIRAQKLSPTALFKLGLARERHTVLDPDEYEGRNTEDIKELKKKLEGAIGAIQILTERAERAEAQYRAERAYRTGEKQ